MNQLIREELSRLIRRQVKDPRVGVVTVTDVEVTPDLEHATVYVRTVDPDRPVEEIVAGLESASGFLRHELGKELRLRRIPELSFEADRSLERARRIETLLEQALGSGEDGRVGEGGDGSGS